MSMIQFFTTTQAKYDAAVKDANALYFCEDTQVLFKGDKRYGFEVITVESFENEEAENALRGVLYINKADNKVYYSDGKDWVEVGVLSGYVTAAANEAVNDAKKYTDAEIKKAISGVYRFKDVVETVAELPTSGMVSGDVYHVVHTNPYDTEKDSSAEYVWVVDPNDPSDTGSWEKLGTYFQFTGTTNNIPVYDGTGCFTDSEYSIGVSDTQQLNTFGAANKLATELATKALLDKKANLIGTEHEGEVAIIDAFGQYQASGATIGENLYEERKVTDDQGNEHIETDFATETDVLATETAVAQYVGNVVSGGISVDLTRKANKVIDGGEKMEGNLAGLDGAGDLTDSLVAAGAAAYNEATFGKSDVEGRTLLATEKAVTEYAEGTFAKQVEGTENDIVFVGVDGQVKDSGKSVIASINDTENVPTAKAVKEYVDAAVEGVSEDIPDISGKADKVTDAVSGNLAGLDDEGNLTDSGFKGGSATLGSAANVLATEAAVVTALTWKTL